MAELFTRMTLMELFENHRAHEDPAWAALIKSFRTALPGARPFQGLRSRFQEMIIQKGDVESNTNWNEAPICSSGNGARMSLIATRANAVAEGLNVPVIKWRLPIFGDAACRLTTQQTDALYNSDTRLWGYFIAGANGFLTENINPERSVSNGSPVIYHSLTLGCIVDDHDEGRQVSISEDRHRIRNACAGQVVTLENPPLSINVVLGVHQSASQAAVQQGEPGDDTARAHWNSIIHSYADVTVVEGEVVLPICMDKTSSVKCFLLGVGAFTIPKLLQHGCELAIAVTFHKAQGRTMNLVVGCFNKPPQAPHITYEAVLVFMSRVRNGNNCKLLPLLPGQDFDHLLNLHPSPYLIAFVNGYDSTGRFDARLAADAWAAAIDAEARFSHEHSSSPPKKRTIKASSPTITPNEPKKQQREPPHFQEELQTKKRKFEDDSRIVKRASPNELNTGTTQLQNNLTTEHVRCRLRMVDYLYSQSSISHSMVQWATNLGFEVSIGDSAERQQMGWGCGAIASIAAFKLINAGSTFMDTDTSDALHTNEAYSWLQHQDANGNIEFSLNTKPDGSSRLSTTVDNNTTTFLTDDEVSYL